MFSPALGRRKKGRRERREKKKRRGEVSRGGGVCGPGTHNVKAEGCEGHSPLNSELKANLGCMKFCLKDRGEERDG